MPETLRLFTAIELPDHVIAALREVSPHFPELRVLPAGHGKPHITLKFIGDLEKERLPALDSLLAGLGGPPREIGFTGLGAFLRPNGAIFWAGARSEPDLKPLVAEMDDSLFNGLGIGRSKGPFFPHVTLARTKRYRKDLKFKAKEYQKVLAPPFTATSFGLYKSELKPTGAIHTLLFEYKFSVASEK
ncbi:MAG: RNA 2',3'-cyclic phosphodiesterase [Deltaproteobacteria bacterium]|jgi:2'-5' RNA ligase|nr:RNA 2',3'-cyclic phosphodiesterase [Deltaproteobacteria bacterium]